MGLVTLPMVTAKARVSSNSLGESRCSRASSSTSGVPTTARVSFMSSAELRPAASSRRSISASVERAPCRRRWAVWNSSPLRSRASPMTKAPNKKPITSQSMAVRVPAGVMSPESSTAAAPRPMAAQMGTWKRPSRRTAMSRNTTIRATMGKGMGKGRVARRAEYTPAPGVKPRRPWRPRENPFPGAHSTCVTFRGPMPRMVFEPFAGFILSVVSVAS